MRDLFARIFERKLWKNYQDYLERHDAFYPTRPTLNFRGFKYWARQWDLNYQKAWDSIYKWMDEHEHQVEFQGAPDFRTVHKLEEMLCV